MALQGAAWTQTAGRGREGQDGAEKGECGEGEGRRGSAPTSGVPIGAEER